MLAVALVLVAAGLAPNATAQTATRVRIGSSIAEGYSEAFFAQDAGFFQKAALNVDVQPFSNGPIVATAVANGTIDIGAGSTITIASGLSHGIPFVILAPAVLETPKAPVGVICVAKSSTIRGPKDLEGKTVAVSGLRQAGDLAVRAWLAKGGVDLGKVQIIESSFAQMGAGIERGTFAAANMSEPTLSLALKTNAIRCIDNPYAAIGTTYMEGVWYTTRDFVQKNPELARRVSEVLLETGRWANTHHEETAAIVARITKIDIDTIRSETRPIFGETMSAADLQPELDAAYKFGFLTRPVSAGDFSSTNSERPMIIIDNNLVHELLTMKDCIDVQDAAFRGLSTGASIHRPRVDLYYPCERDDGYFRWGTMEGANGNYFAIRMKSDILTWPKAGSGQTMEKYCIEPGTYCGLIFLVSTRNGEPLAFINDGILQHFRVGGGAGLGVKYLSRKDSHIVGMLGSGGMARTYLEAFSCVRDITECRVYSPTKANREEFAAEMSAKFKMKVVAVDSAREAVRGADIVSACTDSLLPVFEADWVEPGMHITNVNLNEFAESVRERVDVFVRQGSLGMDFPESGRFQKGLGGSPAAYVGGTDEEVKRIPKSRTASALLQRVSVSNGPASAVPEFTDIASGKVPGRKTDRDVTFYLNAGNQGLQFSCVGGWVYELARKRNVGREIPTEWFLQDIRD